MISFVTLLYQIDEATSAIRNLAFKTAPEDIKPLQLVIFSWRFHTSTGIGPSRIQT
jgi:hypothetical protein